MSFTPGPWIIRKEAKAPNAVVIHTPSEEIVATAWNLMLPNGASPFTDNEANARMISAAPDLLAACERALGRIEFMQTGDSVAQIANAPMVRQLRAAIAKARGIDAAP